MSLSLSNSLSCPTKVSLSLTLCTIVSLVVKASGEVGCSRHLLCELCWNGSQLSKGARNRPQGHILASHCFTIAQDGARNLQTHQDILYKYTNIGSFCVSVTDNTYIYIYIYISKHETTTHHDYLLYLTSQQLFLVYRLQHDILPYPKSYTC